VLAIGRMPNAVLDSKGTVDALVNYLKDVEPRVRAAAAMAIGNLGEAAASYADVVAELLDDGEEDTTWMSLNTGGGAPRASADARFPRCAAMMALARMKAFKQADAIARKLNDECWEVRMCALEALSEMDEAGRDAGDKIQKLLEDDMWMVRERACQVIGQLKAEDQATALAELIPDKVPSVRIAALLGLAEFPDMASAYSTEVFDCMKDPNYAVQAAAITCLGSLGDIGQCYTGVIAQQLLEEDPALRAAACRALGKMGEYGAAFAEEVAECLTDTVPAVKIAAAGALAAMGTPAVGFTDNLLALANDPYEDVGEAARGAIATLKEAS